MMLEGVEGVTRETAAKFELFYDLLVEKNKLFNLTALTERQDVESKHFFDSLTGARFLDEGEKVCDVGCGAGFPSIPLALVRPNCAFTLIDSLGKRIAFVNEAIQKLNLGNCRALHMRIEEFAAEERGAYDKCVARAVAPLGTLLEYALPLLKVGGALIAYKGAAFYEEAETARDALNILGGEISEVYETTLGGGEKRCVAKIVKKRSTPAKYPRAGNKPRVSPL